MSRDIRSFFLSSKSNSPKNASVESKPRKKVKKVITSDEDEEKSTSSPKNKKTKVVNSRKTRENEQHRSKKRTIISSDEDEIDKTSHAKSKKLKVTDGKSSNNVEKPLEIVEDPAKVFSKGPIKRVNAVKVTKKITEEKVKKSVPHSKVDFMSEDDEFDATLNQLDTSQIEDEYISSIKNEKSEKEINKIKHTEKSISENGGDTKKTAKAVSDTKEKEKQSNEKTNSLDKPKIEKNDKNSKKDVSKTKLEIEKESTAHKTSTKAKDVDYNDIIQEKVEKKKHNAILYQNYLHRGGARNPGSKDIPEGANQCLANLSFLITGVLESLERQEAEEIIKQYGGKILGSVSKKLNYIIIGDEPGPSKLAKAESLGIKQISEDDLLDLIRTRPAGKDSQTSTASSDNKRKRENTSSCDEHKSPNKVKKNKEDLSSENKVNDKSPVKAKECNDSLPTKVESQSEKKKESPIKDKISESKVENKVIMESIQKIGVAKTDNSLISEVSNKISDGVDHLDALVEKYRPKELKQIIGQTGDKSNANKLLLWLKNWHKNHSKNSTVPKPKFSSHDDTGTIYKAALLSGPPGIGKTTSAYVVCKQLGFEILEFNASDTRSKRLLQEEIAGILSNNTVKSFLTNAPDKKKMTPKHVLLMDEVDGMAGNEDRGGMQELIAFIKSTEVPIICICNDRNSQKIKTLANYTFDLRFQKPRLEQIRAAMMSVCFKEGIKITPDDLTRIIQSTNQDIRQVINHIAILSAKSQTTAESNQKIKYKNLKLGPWDVVRKVFTAKEHENMTIHDKSDLFFHDYNIAALFVEENYPIVTPAGPKSELHEKLAKCSESLAIGDTIENSIRSKQAWSLLPVQACFSSVIPGSVMSGFINSQINFPSWLGRNSKRSKCDRLLQDLTVHARITTGASKEAVNLDYLRMLVDSIVRPLAVEGAEGVEKAIDVMNKYHLTRDDLDALLELTKWPHTRDPMQSVDTKTKAAFTRAYNKTALFSSASTMKKKAARDNQDEDFITSDNEPVSDNDDDDGKIENDKLIKAKTSKAKSAPSESKGKSKTTTKTKPARTKKK